MTHYMRLQDAPFRKIADGTKTYELRLYDEKRQKISAGDRIVFTKFSDETAVITVRVTELRVFPTFAELYRTLPLDKCGYRAEELPNAKPEDMDAYYSPEEQTLYGVVGIGICLE